MAIQTETTVDSRSLPQAYIRVMRVTKVEKDGTCEGIIAVHANVADRLANREPERTFKIQAPYSAQPYEALYAALKLAYPKAINV